MSRLQLDIVYPIQYGRSYCTKYLLKTSKLKTTPTEYIACSLSRVRNEACQLGVSGKPE